ncbi:O-antigen ligase family protein [Natrialba taiwanensis]|uniref:O-antigen ligase family protein n=1 Tax=Natrialba taiwanensis TaxID=160846 RepID=UPI00135F11E0|nr:O-antigen ligase family protein [Natrialba taiwanensis]
MFIFFTEFWANIALFAVTIILSQYVRAKNILYSIFLSGVVFSAIVIYIALTIGGARRIGNTELAIGVNHLSHGMAVAFVVGVCRYYYQDGNNIFGIAGLTVILSGLILTGSRSALLGVGMSVVIFMALLERDTIFRFARTIVTASFGILFISLVAIDLPGITNRLLSIDYLAGSLAYRGNRYLETISIAVSNPVSTLFGVGVHNYVPLSIGEPIIYDPHNIWLSFALYLGIPAALTYTVLHAYIFTSLLRLSISIREEERIAVLLSLVIVSVYVFFSGRMTRIYTIWLIMGLAVEQLYQSSDRISFNKNQC